MTPKEIDIQCKTLLEAIDYAHGDEKCTEDLDGGWCHKCIHLQADVVTLLRSVPRWQLMLAETLDRLKTLRKLIKTYIPRRGRHV